MPTGYTEGIVNGNVTTFKDFATQCARAMGACVHMRDEPFDAPYEPAVISNYYTESLATVQNKIIALKLMTDEELVDNEMASIKNDLQLYEEEIQKRIDVEIKLNEMLTKINNWEPPTPEHQSFKEFMLQQIVSTIDWDCSIEYYTKALDKANKRLSNLNAEDIRDRLVKQYGEDLQYSQKCYDEEALRVTRSNEWAKTLFDSLQNYDETIVIS